MQDEKSNNSSPNSNETTPTNSTPPKSSNFTISPIEIDFNSSIESSKESLKSNNSRTRKSPEDITKKPSNDDVKLNLNDVKNSQVNELKIHEKQIEMKITNSESKIIETKLSQDELDVKTRIKTWTPSASNTLTKSEKFTKALNPKETKSNSSQRQFKDDTEKKSKEQLNCLKIEKENKLSESQIKKNHSRPAVILLDENNSDNSRNSDSSELTFGFEINEQLLLAEDNEETTPTPSPVFTPGVVVPPPFNKPPMGHINQGNSNYQKHVRIFDKYPGNFHINHPGHHPIHQGMPIAHVVQTSPNVIFRFQPPPPVFIRPPPIMPAANLEKFIHPHPKEDFSARYVAPERTVNVQNYNHDKIVSFVGLGERHSFFFAFSNFNLNFTLFKA